MDETGRVAEGAAAGVMPRQAPAPAQPWRPAPAVKAAFGAHAAGVAALAAWPETWPWVAGVLAANHGLFFGASFVPRSRLIGANASRLPAAAVARHEIALTFDDGPDPAVTPQVLDLLESAGARGTFFCVGEDVAKAPDLAREIVRRGHAVENHTQRHPNAFGFFGVARYRTEIGTAQATLEQALGQRPAFFRAPFGIRNPFLDPAVQHLGLRYVSWTRRGLDTVDADADRVLRRLTRGLAAGDILVLHDGAKSIRPRTRATVLDVLPRLLDATRAAGLVPVTLREAWRG